MSQDLHSTSSILNHRLAHVVVREVGDGTRSIEVYPNDTAHTFMPIQTCRTSYPLPLISQILSVKGPTYLCDEIAREESSTYVGRSLQYDILAYIGETEFVGKRILDFGCGSGASTMVLARMFPLSQIVGVELDDDLLSVARMRVAHYGATNAQLLLSPRGEELPRDIGTFDYIVLSAVFEHLLPGERLTVFPLLWSVLRPGGILFLDQTPHRYFPAEIHTTGGIPLLNYLPDHVALRVARRFSRRVSPNESWESLLRRGIRGSTEGQILQIITQHCSGKPTLLEPERLGVQNRIALWYTPTALDPAWHVRAIRRVAAWSMKVLRGVTGITLTPYLALALQKSSS